MTGSRALRLGMAGGGPHAFIGPVHRMAAQLEDRFRIVSGAFSRIPELNRERGDAWAIDPARVYDSAEEMVQAETARTDGIEALAIVTPNATHFPIARAALAAGLPVICEKPMTATAHEAVELAALAQRSGTPFALTYTYTGYAMIREARALVASGAIGAVRKIVVDYPQGWLATAVEGENRQARWRVDPAAAGSGGTVADIGVHAFQIAEYVSGLTAQHLCANLPSVVPGRRLDDDCTVLLAYNGDVPGLLHATQIATGERNGLSLKVHGALASLVWRHQRPGELRILYADGRVEILDQGHVRDASAARAVRLPPGHPEGFIEAFATLYNDFADALQGQSGLLDGVLPGACDGLRSMRFVAAAIRSHRERRWTMLESE